MNLRKIALSVCATAMALAMIPIFPIEVNAVEAKKSYASHIDASKFPHATGSPMDKQMFWDACVNLTGKISFSKARYPGGGIPLNGDNTVYAVISGQNATVYSKDGGGVFAPVSSSYLFFGTEWNNRFKATACDLSGLDTSKATNMVGMFHCSKLTSVNLSGFDTSNVTNMWKMFGSSAIKSIDLSNFDTGNVIDMGLMFYYAQATDINTKNFDTRKTKYMHSMFEGTSDENLDLSGFNTNQVDNMEKMFYGSKAKTINLSSFDISKMDKTTEMFGNSPATNILCRTEEDMNKMKASPNCSATGFRSVHAGTGGVVYNWNNDGKQCYATRNCKCGGGSLCPYNKIEATGINSVVEKEPSCTIAGNTKYTATFSVPWASAQTKTVVGDIKALGHTMGTTSYTWSSDGKSCTAVHKCTRAECNYTESFKGSVKSSVLKQPNCTEKGQTKYDSTFSVNWAKPQTTTRQDINALGHNMSATSYNWAADGKSCSAVRKCSRSDCPYGEISNGVIKANVSKTPTCTEKGQTTYTAAFDKIWAVNQSKTITDVPANGHTWREAWSKDGSRHWHECSVCHIHKDESAHTWDNGKITKRPTCTETGVKMYTCSVCKQTKTEVVKATGHEMGVVSYNWASDGSSCTATRKCTRNGCVYTETSAGTIKSSVSKNSNCTEKGQTKYDATFTVEWAAPQSKTITDIGAAGHKWQEVWAKDSSNHWHECSVCHIHKDETTHTWNSGEVTKEPSCTEAGIKTYTCSVCGQTKTESIPAINHEMGTTSYNWASDGKSCTAVKKCIHEGCDYSEQAVANISSEVNKAATCGVTGDTKYTATFSEDWASEQTKIVTGNIPATGKHIYDNDFDAECNVCGQTREQKTNTIPINETTFPDDNFRSWVLTNVDGKNGAAVMRMARFMSVDTKDGQLDNTEQQATGSIDVHAQKIKDLRGIEYFPNLKILDCSDNQLEDLNLSNNNKLEHVDASNNPGLGKIDINENLDGKLDATVDKDTIVEYVPPFVKKNSGEGSNVPVVLTAKAHTFSVTIPTSLPISVAADGTITCADVVSCKVVNNEEGPVEIRDIVLSSSNNWTIVPTSTAMESEAVNVKKLAMTVMGYETNNGGLDTTSFAAQVINGNEDFGVVYTAKLPTQTVEIDKTPVANVTFTIGWHEAA